VRAGDVVVRVIGTQFRVARYEERITVAVERGIVDVQFRGDVHRLTAGQSWSSQEQTASKPAVAPVDDPVATPKTNDKPAPAIGSNGKPVPAVDAAKVAAEKAAVDEEKAKFYKMAELERRDHEQAIKGYLELAKGNSVWAANALYAAGRLAHDRNDKRARAFLGFYLKRFPNGKNAEDARDLLSRLDGDKQ
jgi:hypothetical protein